MSPKKHTLSSANLKQIDLMLDLQPTIHYIAVILRILQWNGKEKKYSFICFISLILWRSIQPYIFYFLPCALSILKIYQQRQHYLMDKIRRQEQHHHYQYYQQENNEKKQLVDSLCFEQDLTEICDKINFLTNVKNWMQESDTLCNAYHFYSMSSKQIRSIICIGVSCLFTIAYAGWVILLQQQQFHLSSLIWFALLIIMCLHSPWVHPIQIACVRAIMPLFYYSIQNTNNVVDSNMAVLKNEHEENQRGYRFELYHHQRWWFPTGWSNMLLPQDRAVWTDTHLEATPYMNEFRLPPKTTTLILENNQQKIVSWAWVDPKWSKYKGTNTDTNGWQYGSWQWKQWSSQSSGLGICTRRQKWYRHAQRTEYYIDVPMEGQQQEPEEEYPKTSYWDSQSTSGNSSSSGSSSNYASGIITPVDPFIVSFDNKGERMLRRRSSNLSNKSVTFNNTLEACTNSPSADDMYNKYCKTPKPQRFKRFSI